MRALAEAVGKMVVVLAVNEAVAVAAVVGTDVILIVSDNNWMP